MTTSPFVKHSLNNHYNIDPDTNFIRIIYQHGPTDSWKVAPLITRAVKGSSFAIVMSLDSDANKFVSRIYYQDPELCLREHYYSHLGTTDQRALGEEISRLMSIH